MPPTTYWSRWRFDDGVEQYDFWVNPKEVGEPWWDNEYTPEVTTGGSVLVTQSSPKPKEMQFSGTIGVKGTGDMAQYDEFVKWLKKNRRIRLFDHMDRVYEVLIKSFQPKATAPTTQAHPAKHEYTMVVLVLAEPVYTSR